MGSNRRYAAQIDARMAERALEAVARNHEPESLKDAELALDVEPLTRPPSARPCHAWVRYAGIPVRVEAEATAWTARAVAIRWRVSEGRVDRAWVWESAVTERS